MTKDEALLMAIKVFDMYGNKMNSAFADEAYQACKEALEQPTTQELYDNGGNMTINKTTLLHKEPSSNRVISNTWLKELEARIEKLEGAHGAGR